MTSENLRARRTSWAAGEAATSILAAALVLWLPLHHVGVYFCLGECPGPTAEDIATYRVLVGLLAGLIVASFGLAVVRRARWAWAWHVTLAVAGVLSAAVFAVPTVDWADLLRPDPPSYDGGVPCHSGPPNDCPGG